MEQIEVLGYLASVLMGLSLGLIGGGGSILTVPILVYLFQVEAVLATGYSLFIVGLTSLIGGTFYLIKREVDLRTGVIFAIPSFVGVYLTRAYLIPRLTDPVFTLGETSVSKAFLIMAVFAVLMLAASLSMIRPLKTSPVSQTSPKTPLSQGRRALIVSLEGLLVGGVTGFVGAGGGFLIIPALVILVGLPMKIAVGTSLFIIAAKSLLGFAGDIQHQNSIDWFFLFSVSGVAVTGLFIGMFLAKKISEQKLKKGFGYFVLIMGIFILLDQIQKL